MKKYSKILGFVLVVFSCFGAGAFYSTSKTNITESVFNGDEEEAVKKLAAIQAQEDADSRLGQYVLNIMHKTSAGRKLSDAKKQILARSIVRVTSEVFSIEEHRKAFIMVLAIESQFERLAQSPTGPKGLSQVARSSFHEGLKNCGLPIANDDDVWETDLNLYAGACYFRMVLESNGGDSFVAVVAYNQGPNSASVKTYAKSGYLDNLEALKYVARFSYLQRNVKAEKAPGVPDINNLSKTVPTEAEKAPVVAEIRKVSKKVHLEAEKTPAVPEIKTEFKTISTEEEKANEP